MASPPLPFLCHGRELQDSARLGPFPGAPAEPLAELPHGVSPNHGAPCSPWLPASPASSSSREHGLPPLMCSRAELLLQRRPPGLPCTNSGRCPFFSSSPSRPLPWGHGRPPPPIVSQQPHLPHCVVPSRAASPACHGARPSSAATAAAPSHDVVDLC